MRNRHSTLSFLLAASLTAIASISIQGCTEESEPYEGCNLPKYATWETVDNGQWTVQDAKAPVLSEVSLEGDGTGFGLTASPEFSSVTKLYRTTNAGASWTLASEAETLSVSRLQFIGTNVAYATADKGVLLKTTDGGSSWARIPLGTSPLASLYFRDALNGWVGDYGGKIRRTTNGGKDWKFVYGGNVTGTYGPYIYEVYFADASEGRAIGWDNGVGIFLSTHDGGKKWTETMPLDGGTLAGMFFLDENVGWISGTGGNILRTADGGKTWLASSTGTSASVNDVRFLTASTGFAAGSGGYLAKTTDGGANWTPLASGTTGDLNRIQILDANRVWVTEWQQGLIRTTDGGVSWSRLEGVPVARDVQFTSATTGLAAGLGAISRTTDGGATWEIVRGLSHASSLCFSGQNGWLAGNGGVVQRTTNGGATWRVQASGISSNLRTAACVTATLGIAAGDNGTLIRTTDGGASWTSRTLPGGAAVTRLRFAGSTGWAAGAGGSLLKTTDAGESWSTQDPGTSQDLVAIDVLDAQHAYVATAGNALLKTTNGGASWTSSTPDSRVSLTAVAFVNAQVGYAAGGGFPERVFDSADAVPRMALGSAPRIARAGFGGGELEATLLEKLRGPTEIRLAGFFHSPPCPSDTGALYYRGLFRTTDGGQTWGAERIETKNYWKSGNERPWHHLECLSTGRCLAFGDDMRVRP